MFYETGAILPKDKRGHKIERHKFSKPEDERLTDLVFQYGTKKWRTISSLMEDRTPRQCRERWKYYLSLGENVNVNDNWNQEDDDLLISLYEKYGSKWSSMIGYFKNQTVVSLKNRFNKLQRKSRKQNKMEHNCSMIRNDLSNTESSLVESPSSIITDNVDETIQQFDDFDTDDYQRHIILPLPLPISCFMKNPRTYQPVNDGLQV